MKTSHSLTPALLALPLMALLIARCGSPPDSQAAPTVVAIDSTFAQIDAEIARAISGAIAYNVPQSMLLDETKTIQLLVSPSSTAIELKEQVTEPGSVITATVSITPRMKTELKAADPDAFLIQALHDSPEQLLSNTEPTEWRWIIQAKRGGQQELTLTLYRLVEFSEKEYWRQVTYENTVVVDVTLAQRLARFDWKWLVGILLTGMLIPAAWRYIDKRQKSTSNSRKDEAA